MAAGATLLMRLLGRGGGGHSARRKEQAKALLKHLYYNRRLIRLVLVALIWLVGLYVTWKVSSSSSSSSAAGGGEEGLPVVSLVAKQHTGTWESKLGEQGEVRRNVGAAASSAAASPSAEEGEMGEDDDVASWRGGDDDDDEGLGGQQEEEEQEEGKASAGGAAAPPQAAALELDPAVERRRNHCMAEYGQRRYLEEDEYVVPPILYSYPGSGNTWVRLLVDYATGVYTGSILDDETLMEPLPGQGHCDRSVSVIKAHPNHFEPRRLFNMEQDKKLEEEYERYRRRAAMHKERAAAERGEEIEEEEEEEEEDWDGEGHEEYAEEDEEEDDWNKIRAGPMSLLRQECLHKGGIRGFKRFILLVRNPYDAIWSEYQRKFMTSHHAPITRADFDKEHFTQWAPRYAFKYVMMLNDFHVVERHSKRKDVFILKYEHLKETRKRMAILRKLINFLHLDAPDPARLACADVLGDRPDTHRIKASNAITREEVYTPEVACMMWLIFGERVKKLGYGLPPWVSKEECAAVKYDWSKLMLPRRLRVKQKQAALAMEVGKEAEKGKGKDEAAARKEEGSAKGQVEKRYSK